jgi:hypothetical protein
MTPCTVTTGFFVLRRCGRPAVAGCPACGRPICVNHIADGGMCPECAAARGLLHHPQAAAARHRRGFLSHSSADFGDASMFQFLDSFDRAPFDPDNGGETDYDADGDADGGDDSLVDS